MIRTTLIFLMAMLINCAYAQNQNQTSRIDDEGFNPMLAPFYHGVASGDPTENSVILWTRVTPEDSQTSIDGTWHVALDTGFTQPILDGEFTADETNDFTVKIDVAGLDAGTTYYYYFNAEGKNSLVGRAKTVPTDGVENLKFAVASCSNYEGGFFNAYEMIAERNDLDAVIHLGDYIYEYGVGTYGIGLPDRVNEPADEILNLADYRTRYSLYRMDKDLIRLHQQHTFISIWDDHESANDSYVDGAENHQASEGSWEERKAVSKQVYFEWMPIRDNADNSIYRNFKYGELCDLFMIDTRLEGRVEPPANFDDPDDPARNIISQTQYDWLTNGLQQSEAKWKVIGNQVLFSTFNVGFAAADPTNIDSIRATENLFIDNWESYPTQRNNLIDFFKNENMDNVVIVTGDSHTSWAFDVTKEAVLYPVPAFLNVPQPNPFDASTQEGYDPTTGDGSWAVEFGCPSIASPNFDEAIGAAATAQFELIINNPIPGLGNYNPHLKLVDLDRHGYFILDLTAEKAQSDFFYVPTLAVDTTGEEFGGAALSLDGDNHLQISPTPSPPKAEQDIPTPLEPNQILSDVEEEKLATIFSLYPNPSDDIIYLQVGFQESDQVFLALFNQEGKIIRKEKPISVRAGVYNFTFELNDVPPGNYILSVIGEKGNLQSRKIIVQK